MARVHLFEFHDQAWVPAVWREALTDFMAFFAVAFDVYCPLWPRLGEHLRATGTTRVVDLCSGGSGPAKALLAGVRLADGGAPRLLLTDKYPHVEAFERVRRACGDGVDFSEEPVDATDVPSSMSGFRTLFASFHHFHPEEARKILADAAAKGQGIAVFEYTERNFLVWGAPLLLTPPLVWATGLFALPFRWRYVLWVNLLPVVPLIGAWDGFVSCLRTYTPDELRALADSCAAEGYTWEIGRVRSFGACHVTYLFGYPTSPPDTTPGSRL